MHFTRNIGKLFLVSSIILSTNTTASSLPESENDFYLATDEIVSLYSDIPRLHRTGQNTNRKISINTLSSIWGKPQTISRNDKNIFGSLFLGISSLMLTLPNPLAAIGVATGLGSWSYSRSQETILWDKGDYLIEVNTQHSSRNRLVSSWKWMYKSLDRPVPILGKTKKSHKYFQIGYGKELSSLLDNSADYGNGQYFLFGHNVANINHYKAFIELGAHWGSPGNATPGNAQWVRIPLNVSIKTPTGKSGFSHGGGAGYEFKKEFSGFDNEQVTLTGATTIFLFTDYRFSSELSFGMRGSLQFIERAGSSNLLNTNQLSSYVRVNF